MRWFAIIMMTFLFGFGVACNPAPRGRSSPEASGAGGGAGGGSAGNGSAGAPDGDQAGEHSGNPDRSAGVGNGSGAVETVSEEVYRIRRERMVRTQIEAREIKDPRILAAMRKVRRHLFIPKSARESAYDDGPVAIGREQTISQPYIVALMTELVRPRPGDKVLEIGTGSGYQAAVLAELVGEVDTIEIIEPLGLAAEALLRDLGYTNVHCRIGDGYRGWPEKAPFDSILVTAAPGSIPEPLKQQLAVGGRLVIPVGTSSQDLVLVTRTELGYSEELITAVRFVPMTGEAEQGR